MEAKSKVNASRFITFPLVGWCERSTFVMHNSFYCIVVFLCDNKEEKLLLVGWYPFLINTCLSVFVDNFPTILCGWSLVNVLCGLLLYSSTSNRAVLEHHLFLLFYCQSDKSLPTHKFIQLPLLS